MDDWGAEPPVEYANELARRIRVRMKNVMANIRDEQPPKGFFDYRIMKEVPEVEPFPDLHQMDARALTQDRERIPICGGIGDVTDMPTHAQPRA